MTASGTKACIATVVTEDFVPGALVNLHSFRKHNKSFRGDFVIIHDELSDDARPIGYYRSGLQLSGKFGAVDK